jgi:hypothetical protein
MAVAAFTRKLLASWREHGLAGLKQPLLTLTRARGTLLLVAAALGPPLIVIVSGSTLYDGVRHLLFVIPMLALLAGGALMWFIPVLRRSPIVLLIAVVLAVAHVAMTMQTLAALHPFEYVAMNVVAGGTRGAYGRFELDYWGAAATEALRRLEHRLDHDRSGRFAAQPPRVLVCIPWRERRVAQMFRRNWRVETDVRKADFLIGTERWNCGEGQAVILVDQVERVGKSFAWIYTNRHAAGD